MPYIRNGKVVERSAFDPKRLVEFFWALIAGVLFFLQSIINPQVSNRSSSAAGGRNDPYGGAFSRQSQLRSGVSEARVVHGGVHAAEHALLQNRKLQLACLILTLLVRRCGPLRVAPRQLRASRMLSNFGEDGLSSCLCVVYLPHQPLEYFSLTVAGRCP